ncbi:superoxide dismutase [Sporosarcina sp. NCCP-2716]|uniref:superoxide dismutase family protein n=1 Tax=Sporosarcina sp. NCCP-2716 TaxID=2943679 RepID=UPI00203E47F7|nr:superoxide dismutase family protein [Sporosarcina sp. NCCP-2716]GKV68182.1 superoxide dismutase [Sporosarcina sp. NCCP-2716]
MKKTMILCPVIALILLLGACGSDTTDGNSDKTGGGADQAESAGNGESVETKPFSVLVDLKDREGKTTGTAELSETDQGVSVFVKVDSLTPGKHGIHFHEKGVCEGPGFESAGGHFNPAGKEHGLEMPGGPHAGDLPNLEVESDGTAEDRFTSHSVTLETGKTNSLLRDGGTALVIHAGEDDGESQPSGDSGDRIACGIIK